MTLWTPQQEAVFAALPQGSSHSVNAVAGSGKTSTIVEGLRRAASPALCVAFNKRIAEELTKRLSGSAASAATMNSLGHRAWAKAIGKRLTLNTNKLYALACEHYSGEAFSDVLGLARAARVSGLVPERFAIRGLLPDSLESWESIADYFDLNFNAETYSAARKVLDEAIKQGYAGTIDFDDQIYLSALFSGRFEKVPLVVVDEAQDLSPLQHRMLQKIVGERICIVGDPRQCIYSFRGASANSMAELSQMFSASELPLSVSFRCPKAVVAEARAIVPWIESAPSAPEGEVQFVDHLSLSDIPPRAHIVCRYNGPIFKLAWALIKSGRPATILGADIGQGLIKLIKKLAPESLDMASFLNRLRSWAAAEIERKPHREAIIRDREISLISISEAVHTSQELCDLINKLFSPGGTISLSSIHKAKGLEWDTVIFYLPHLLPSRYATTPWQLEQEENLRYVGITRAKRRLIYAGEIL